MDVSILQAAKTREVYTMTENTNNTVAAEVQETVATTTKAKEQGYQKSDKAVQEAVATTSKAKTKRSTKAKGGRPKRAEEDKASRQNIMINPDQLDYVRLMSRMTGKTHSQFINMVLKWHEEAHGDLYKQAKSMLKKLEGNG
jgi:hypothetical protein